MTHIYRRLEQQGWVYWGEGVWLLDRPDEKSLLAKERLDGTPIEQRRWDLFEDQGEADPDTDWRWGQSLGIFTNNELLSRVAAPAQSG